MNKKSGFSPTCLEYGLKPDIVGLSVYRWINPTAKDISSTQRPQKIANSDLKYL